jgi:hypothetical protein
MRRILVLGSVAFGVVSALLLTAVATSDTCSVWNPLSCNGPDPELLKYAR